MKEVFHENSHRQLYTKKGESLLEQVRRQLHDKLPVLKAAAIPSSMADEIFFHILSYYAPVDAESQRCRNDSGKYVEAALRNDMWAMRMFDASSKLEAGMMEGNFQGLGSYDACLSIDTPEGFIGQHCVVGVQGISVPALDKLMSKEDDAQFRPLYPQISMCVPSTCTYHDVEVHMNVALGPLNGTTKLTSRSCSTRYPEPLENKDYMAISVIVGLVGIVLLATFSDRLSYSTSKVRSTGCLSSFSLYRNLPKLSTKRDDNELSILHGLRFLAIVWIVIGHRYILSFSVPIFGLSKPEAYSQDWALAPVYNVMVAVEIFLVLSGLLVTYNFFKSMEDNKNFNVPKFYFHRYIRITPVYVVMILVHGVILYHLSDGPMWKKMTGLHRDNCSKNWWAGLLYISNYFTTSMFNTCVPQAWYLSTDTQLYLLSPLFLIPLHKRPKLGLSLIFGFFIATISASFCNANYHELKAGAYINAYKRTFRSYNLDYAKTHLRSASYFMGLGLGYFVYQYKQGFLKVKLSKVTLICGWLMSAVLMFGVIFSITIFQKSDYNGPQLVDSLYIALHRPMFSAGFVWVVFIGITGNGGFVNKMFSVPILKPFSTLTYGIYMTHATFQTLEISRTRVPVNYTPFDLILKSVSDLAFSIAAAFVIFLVVEAPFLEVDKWLFPKDNKSKREENDLPTLPVHACDKTHL